MPTISYLINIFSAGIRVNAVLPGFTVTPMTDVVPDKVRQQITMLIPLGRMGQPEGLNLINPLPHNPDFSQP